MSFPRLLSWVMVFLVVTFEAKVGLGQINGIRRNYITWRDLKMEGPPRNFPLRDIGGNNRNKLVIVVDKYGRGDSFTVQGAVDMVPENNVQRVKIHILPGVYREKVRIPVNKPYISFIGNENEPSSTVITWHDKASDNLPNGSCCLGTWNSASVSVESDYFCATGITFENTVIAEEGGVKGYGYQAVAFRISGEKAMFYKVRFLGSQDTLLDESGSHYFFRCFIQGSTDFIFGNAKSLYQECGISVVGDGYAIAAQHRNSDTDETGFAFLNCTVSGTGPIYLGRAWGNYSRIIYSYTEFDIDVRPQGWEDWRVPSRQSTVVFGEYECRGRGADRSRRVEWSKALTYWEARPFLDIMFIRGDQWLKL
ncbi:pectin lyase-like superfamily protein [Striga asiatica]|uniref:Pectinesterase n=1 Tax=Striga asiatica TaxID=4170 RepID=A0A5A7PJ20_STRAF|nr:pectin lyase-like superfamily protein [Striga asiatica]